MKAGKVEGNRIAIIVPQVDRGLRLTFCQMSTKSSRIKEVRKTISNTGTMQNKAVIGSPLEKSTRAQAVNMILRVDAIITNLLLGGLSYGGLSSFLCNWLSFSNKRLKYITREKNNEIV